MMLVASYIGCFLYGAIENNKVELDWTKIWRDLCIEVFRDKDDFVRLIS